MPEALDASWTLKSPDGEAPVTRSEVTRPNQEVVVLTKFAPAVLKWAARSSDNAAILITRPLDAIDRSGAKVTAGDRAALEQHLRSVMPTEVLPAGIELVAANVNVAKGRKP